MALWDNNNDKKSADDVKAENVRGLAGFDSLSDVKKDAPTTDSEASPTPSRGSGRKASRSPQSQARAASQQETEDARKKQERKERALELLGMEFCKDIAAVPYEVWAFWMSDPALSLSKEEQESLAKTYFLLAQALEPDLSSPGILAIIVVLSNVRFVGRRFTHLAIKKATGQDIPPDQVEQVLKDSLLNRKPS